MTRARASCCSRVSLLTVVALLVATFAGTWHGAAHTRERQAPLTRTAALGSPVIDSEAQGETCALCQISRLFASSPLDEGTTATTLQEGCGPVPHEPRALHVVDGGSIQGRSPPRI